MPRAENVKGRRRQNRLNKDVQRAAANQASVILRILVQVKSQRAGPFTFHHFTRSLPDLGFDASAADGTYDRSIVAHQHLRRLKRRDRSANIDNGCHRATASFFAQTDDLFIDVHGMII